MKTVKIDCVGLYDIEEFEPIRSETIYENYSWKEFDNYLKVSYGIKIYDDFNSVYEIIDETKFALFMLKHSEYIEELIYE